MRGQFHEQRWMEAHNACDYDIPAFGLITISGATWDGPGRTVLEVQRPSGASQNPIAINSWKPIAAGDHGLVTLDGPAWVLYDQGDDPQITDSYGTQTNLFTAAEGETGLTVVGGKDTTKGIVLVTFAQATASKVLIITFRLAEELTTLDETCTGTIYSQYGPGTAHTCTGAGAITLHNMWRNHGSTPEVQLYEFYGDTDDFGRAAWMGPAYGDGTHFKILIVECP